MKQILCLVTAVFLISACQTTEYYPENTVDYSSYKQKSSVQKKERRHKDRVNYSAIEAVEGDEDEVCVGSWCGCSTE